MSPEGPIYPALRDQANGLGPRVRPFLRVHPMYSPVVQQKIWDMPSPRGEVNPSADGSVGAGRSGTERISRDDDIGLRFGFRGCPRLE
jgi:hypothetical protein